MAYLDRVRADLPLVAYRCDVATSKFKNVVGTVAPTHTPNNAMTVADPISSGGTRSVVFDPVTTVAVAMPISAPPASADVGMTFEFVINIPPMTTGTQNICDLGGTSGVLLVIDYRGFGYVNIPVSGYTSRRVYFDLEMNQANHIVIAVKLDACAVYVNGEDRKTVKAGNGLRESSTTHQWLTFAATANFPATATYPYLLDTFAQYGYEMSLLTARRHFLECFWQQPVVEYVRERGGLHLAVNPSVQDYVVDIRTPETSPWSEWDLTNTEPRQGGAIGLQLRYPEVWDAALYSYVIEDLTELSDTTEGYIHLSFTYATATSANKGLLFLDGPPEKPHYEIYTNVNTPTVITHTPVFDANGYVTSYTPVSVAGTALADGAGKGVGLVWDTTGMWLIVADTSYAITTEPFDPTGYSLYLGNRKGLASGTAFGANYIARIGKRKPTMTTTAITASYGPHAFDSSLVATEPLPVYASGTAATVFPMATPYTQYIYSPTIEIEGYAVVTDGLVT